MQKIYLAMAVLLGLIANTLGAFGAHALKRMIDAPHLAIFQTGVQYQFYHSMVLFIVALLMFHIRNRWIVMSGIGFIVGCVLFSGSLYLLSLTGITWLGMITPLGGLAFTAGWILLLVGVLKEPYP